MCTFEDGEVPPGDSHLLAAHSGWWQDGQGGADCGWEEPSVTLGSNLKISLPILLLVFTVIIDQLIITNQLPTASSLMHFVFFQCHW